MYIRIPICICSCICVYAYVHVYKDVDVYHIHTLLFGCMYYVRRKSYIKYYPPKLTRQNMSGTLCYKNFVGAQGTIYSVAVPNDQILANYVKMSQVHRVGKCTNGVSRYLAPGAAKHLPHKFQKMVLFFKLLPQSSSWSKVCV